LYQNLDQENNAKNSSLEEYVKSLEKLNKEKINDILQDIKLDRESKIQF
jgi:hypothetical protein